VHSWLKKTESGNGRRYLGLDKEKRK